jgi:hypothetical protein
VFESGTTEVGTEAVPVCTAEPGQVIRVKNLAEDPVYLGSRDVTADGSGAGFPLDSREVQEFAMPRPREAPVIPAPPDDTQQELALYGRTASGTAQVAWIRI